MTIDFIKVLLFPLMWCELSFFVDYKFTTWFYDFKMSFDFLNPNCIVLQLTNYNSTKLHSFPTNMGYLQSCYEIFITHCEGLCFELELKALAPWECPPFCHMYMLTTS